MSLKQRSELKSLLSQVIPTTGLEIHTPTPQPNESYLDFFSFLPKCQHKGVVNVSHSEQPIASLLLALA